MCGPLNTGVLKVCSSFSGYAASRTRACSRIGPGAQHLAKPSRLEASSLVHNAGSQRVLVKAGFRQIGMAPRYLEIAGEWQDHNLYQIVLHD